MNILGDIIGDFCKVILPITEEYYLGNFNSSTTVCTLSSINLLKKFANSKFLDHISIASNPDPFFNVSKSKIQYFQNNVSLVNMIDEINFEVISNKIKTF